MNNIFLVMGGGAVGALARYQLGRLAGQVAPGAAWPWGTFVANLLGALAMGLLAGWVSRTNAGWGEAARLLLGVGILGGFTTFSAFSLEMILMMERGHLALALAYVLCSVVGAGAALAAGLGLMRSVA